AIDVPFLHFDAFHPDLCYLRRKSTGRLLAPHYNSRIVFWAYMNSVDPSRVPALFCESVFERLGYMNRWHGTVAWLRGEFAKCDIDFARYFLPVKRMGAFMHSSNHPKIDAITALAKVVSLRLGRSEDIMDTDIGLTDALAGTNLWPIYPPI